MRRFLEKQVLVSRMAVKIPVPSYRVRYDNVACGLSFAI